MNVRDVENIISFWGEELVGLEKRRDAYLVITRQGKRCLKAVHPKKEKILFMIEAMNHLKANGFNRMAMCLPALDKSMVAEYHGTNYIVQEWVEGVEPDYRNMEQMVKAAETLALCHQAGIGFIPAKGIKVKNNLGKWIRKLEENYQDLVQYIGQAKSKNCPTPFEKRLISIGPWLEECAEQSIWKLQTSRYSQLVKEARQRGCLVHGDPATRNFIMQDDQVVLIDFDSTAMEISVVDIWKLLRRFLRRNHWQLDKMERLISAYNSKHGLDNNELKVLGAFLEFPERVWRIAREFYEKKHIVSWNELLLTQKMGELCNQWREKDNLLRSFENNLI
ncbi:MAG: CotS family spore coat protein [Bacillota bacterium]